MSCSIAMWAARLFASSVSSGAASDRPPSSLRKMALTCRCCFSSSAVGGLLCAAFLALDGVLLLLLVLLLSLVLPGLRVVFVGMALGTSVERGASQATGHGRRARARGKPGAERISLRCPG